MSYDANGNLAKQWQGVVGGDGLARTSFKAFRYDKLGQLVNTIEPSSYGVSIFADSNYQGNSRSFTVGDYNLSELGIGGDMLSSLTVKQGWTVTLYADGNFTGATRTVSANTASLSDFNDQTSSLRITAPSKLTVNNTQMQYNAFGELISKGLVGNDVMWPGDLRADQSIVSANGRYQLIMQPDGNLVTYDLQNNRKVVWKNDGDLEGLTPSGGKALLCLLGAVCDTEPDLFTGRWSRHYFCRAGSWHAIARATVDQALKLWRRMILL